MTDMQAAIAQAVAMAIASMNQPKGATKAKSKGKPVKGSKKKPGREKLTDAEKAVFAAKNDADCITAFQAAGHKNVQPRINVLTYKKWLEKGRRVKKGEKSVAVGPFRLFHENQTSPVEEIIGA